MHGATIKIVHKPNFDTVFCTVTSDCFVIKYMIYLLTVIGLIPGGSSTVHIYTQTIHRTTQLINIEQHN